MVTSRMFDYAPPDTGVSNLQLVALERLPSIEGADKKQMAVTSLRGQFVGAGLCSARSSDEICSSGRSRVPPLQTAPQGGEIHPDLHRIFY